MTAPVGPGQVLALRVLMQPNPGREDDPQWWRVSDVVRHAAEVYGCVFPQKSASTCITQTLARKGYVESKRGVRGAVLYSLTAEVRDGSRFDGSGFLNSARGNARRRRVVVARSARSGRPRARRRPEPGRRRASAPRAAKRWRVSSLAAPPL